ncbi:MAG: hypothetical protein JXP34_28970 [Planctomycetes bacterium]|nr:hypothetical protein [Planctomycetota bacterium]
MRPEAFGSAPAFLLIAAAGLAAAAAAESDRPVALRVIAGFDGRILDPRRFPLVIEMENTTGEVVRGGLAVALSEKASAWIARDVEVPAGTTIRRHMVAEPSWAGQKAEPLRILFSAGSNVLQSEAPVPFTPAQAVVVVREARGYAYPPIVVEREVIASRFRSRIITVPIGSWYVPVVGCRPEYLPIDPFAYDQVLSVILCDADPVRWEAEQVRALEEYVRRGGTLVIEGGERAKYLAISPIVSRWLAGTAVPVVDSKGEPIAEAFPLGLGTVLRSRSELVPVLEHPMKAGTETEGMAEARRLLIERRFASHEFPGGAWMLGVTKELVRSRRQLALWGGFPLCAGYFLLFILCLAAGAVWGLKRRGALRPLIALASVTGAFTAGIPLLFGVLDRQPCAMSLFRTIGYGPDGQGVELLAAGVRSGGGTDTRLRISGKDLVAQKVLPRPDTGPASFVRRQALLRHPSELSVDLPLGRWESGGVLVLSDVQDPPPLAADAVLSADDSEILVTAKKESRAASTVIAGKDVAIRFGSARGGPLGMLLRRGDDGRTWTGIGFRIPGFLWSDEEPSGDSGYHLGTAVADGGALDAGETWSTMIPLPDQPGGRQDSPTAPIAFTGRGFDPPGWMVLSYWVIPPRGMSVTGEGVRFDTEEACLVQQFVPIRRPREDAPIEEEP